MSTAVGCFCMLVGGLIAVWWAAEIRHGALSRPDRSRAEIGLHLTGELATAALLLLGGGWLLLADRTDLALVSLGMLLYTVLVSPGYFLNRRELPPVVMFGVLALTTLAAIVVLMAA
jgi:hypothetical protein